MAAVEPFLNAAAQAAEPIIETETSATTLPNASTWSSSGSVPTYEGIMSSKVPSVTGPHPSSLVPPGVGLQDVAYYYSHQCFLPPQQAGTSSPPAFLFSSSSETAHAVEPEAPEPELALELEEIDQNVIWNALDLEEERELMSSREYRRAERIMNRSHSYVQNVIKTNVSQLVVERNVHVGEPEDINGAIDTLIAGREANMKFLRYFNEAMGKTNSRHWKDFLDELRRLDRDNTS